MQVGGEVRWRRETPPWRAVGSTPKVRADRDHEEDTHAHI